RDLIVTGVQTCALPISHLPRHGARDRLLAPDEQVAHPVEDLAADRGRRLRPPREAALRRRDGAGDILRARARKGADHVVPIRGEIGRASCRERGWMWVV